MVLDGLVGVQAVARAAAEQGLWEEDEREGQT